MSVYNQSRSRVIQIIFITVLLVIVGQLINLQLFSSKYKLQAESNALYRKVMYPDRGIIYDRKGKAVLENTIMYDLVVTPSEIKQTDTLSLCGILNIDTSEFRKRILTAIIKNSRYKSSVFEPLLTPELYARLNENMYKFPGFVLAERPVRNYPFSTAANVLGYLAEVDTGFLRRHREEGYEMGDYTGMTGLERQYERVLMGQRGVKQYLRDNKGRIQGSFQGGQYDTMAIAGKSLHLSLDVELQQLGEELMANKVGTIVAIDPQTGGILCMVSSPTYNPNYLTGPERRKHFSSLYLDPRTPLVNRAMSSTYSPGSTFKTVVGVIGLAEGVIDKNFTITCNGYFPGCGNGKPKCLDKGTFNFTNAIAHSDNSYFATVYKRLLDQNKYGRADSALKVFNKYAYSFGLGKRLGVDMPSEKAGNLPLSSLYEKRYGPRWVSCNCISNSIGQGEVLTTITQLANVMATIANKGWYHIPHLVDSIEGGDKLGLLEPFKEKHTTFDISSSYFENVHDGMQAVMEYGTGAAAQVPGIVVCGKTGTVENYDRGVKQADHAFFGAFAPRNNPRIAIAVMCENAGFGARSAAPIASLLIEKYLKDSIPEPERKAEVDRVTKLNLIPARMLRAMATQDSLRKVKEAMRIYQEQEAAKDSANNEEGNATEQETKPTQSNPIDTQVAKPKKKAPVKNGPQKRNAQKLEAALPNDERNNNRNYKRV